MILVDFFVLLRNCIFGADPTILLDFTSNLGSIVPLFPVAKNKKIDYFALFFSQTELPCRAPRGGARPTDGLREIHIIL